MPKKGFASVTIPKKTNDILVELKKKTGKSKARLVTEAFEKEA